ncbi:MAG: hypothetical protein ACK5LX_03285 [Oscillospiraceae bacterium]
MSFKYKYEHLHCGFCAEIESEGCPHLHCPHILENMDDLLDDPEFIEAVMDADECGSYHRPVLLMVQGIMEAAGDLEDRQPVAMIITPFCVFCTFKLECEGCSYPRHGFICYNKRDDSCLKDDVDAIMRKDNSRATPH